MLISPLEARTKGLYPVSIGTSIALEALLGTSKDHPHPKDIPPYWRSYNCLCINVRTLFRNIISSVSTSLLSLVNYTEIETKLMNEMVVIKNIIATHTDGQLLVGFYLNSYSKIKRMFKQGEPTIVRTVKQKHVQQLEMNVLNKLANNPLINSENISLEKTDERILTGMGKNIYLTHLPVDLLLAQTVNPTLLESHTGRIKNIYTLYSKLKNANEYVPFNKFTIQLFGDTGGTFMPYNTTLAKELRSIADNSGMSAATTEFRFLQLVKQYGSKDLTSLIEKMR